MVPHRKDDKPINKYGAREYGVDPEFRTTESNIRVPCSTTQFRLTTGYQWITLDFGKI